MIVEKYIVFVPNTFGPYGYELVQHLAFPNGFAIRFRFDEEWVEQRVQRKYKSLTPKNAYIVLRDFDSGNLFPVRFASVTDIKKIGPIYHFTCVLRDIVNVGFGEHSKFVLDSFRSEFSANHADFSANNKPGQHLSPLVFLSNYKPLSPIQRVPDISLEDDDASRWMSVVCSVGQLEHFKNVVFFRLLSVRTTTGSTKEAVVKNGALQLREGRAYQIDVTQYVPNGDSSPENPNDIRLKADPKALKVLRGEQRAVGKYDVLKFVLYANRVFASIDTYLDIEYSPARSLRDRIEPRISVAVHIKAKLRRHFIRLGVAVVSVSLYFFPDALSFISIIEEELVKDVGIIGFTVTLIGAFEYVQRGGGR